MSAVTITLSRWKKSPAGLRCLEICSDLRHLGFTVRDGKRAGHKIVSHMQVAAWFGTDFDCGHGSNNQVKPGYVRKLIRILNELKDDLEKL